MFRPVSVEIWLSDKNQVKSCFKPHSRCSPPISPCFMGLMLIPREQAVGHLSILEEFGGRTP